MTNPTRRRTMRRQTSKSTEIYGTFMSYSHEDVGMTPNQFDDVLGNLVQPWHRGRAVVVEGALYPGRNVACAMMGMGPKQMDRLIANGSLRFEQYNPQSSITRNAFTDISGSLMERFGGIFINGAYFHTMDAIYFLMDMDYHKFTKKMMPAYRKRGLFQCGILAEVDDPRNDMNQIAARGQVAALIRQERTGWAPVVIDGRFLAKSRKHFFDLAGFSSRDMNRALNERLYNIYDARTKRDFTRPWVTERTAKEVTGDRQELNALVQLQMPKPWTRINTSPRLRIYNNETGETYSDSFDHFVKQGEFAQELITRILNGNYTVLAWSTKHSDFVRRSCRVIQNKLVIEPEGVAPEPSAPLADYKWTDNRLTVDFTGVRRTKNLMDTGLDL